MLIRHGLIVSNIGSYSDPGTVAKLARLAEASGWEFLFVWDHLGYVWDAPTADPWITLTAVAMSTRHLRIGTAVTPVARYRPQRLALTLTSLARLSNNRLILGAGLGGVPGEFAAFGESADPAERAGKLDEGLELVSELLSGREIEYRGRYFKADGISLAPIPTRPIPIFIGGNSKASLIRAAHWNGWIADSPDAVEMTVEPADIERSIGTIRDHREANGQFEVAVQGYSNPDDTDLVMAYKSAGATMWLEAIHDIRGSLEEMTERIKAGPASAFG